MKKSWLILLCIVWPALCATAQDSLGKQAWVQLTNVSPVAVGRGKPGIVKLSFRIAPGFHVNSNKPNSDLLIPTTLKLDPPTDISVANVTYPAGEDKSFPFAPDQKLSIYEGDFVITAKVLTVGAVRPGTYRVRGDLRYQACDNAACYPPRSLPLNIDIRVTRAPSTGTRRNPAQSPNVR